MLPNAQNKPWTHDKYLEVRQLLAEALALLETVAAAAEAATELRLAIAALDEGESLGS